MPIEPDLDVWRTRFGEIAAVADVIKASDEDIAALQGGGKHGRDAFDAFAADALGRGAGLVLVTRGGDGSLAYAADGRVAEVEGVRVDVRDTVGAGDTFQAATLHRLGALGAMSGGTLRLDDVDLEELAGFATAAAAITCTRSGAESADDRGGRGLSRRSRHALRRRPKRDEAALLEKAGHDRASATETGLPRPLTRAFRASSRRSSR